METMEGVRNSEEKNAQSISKQNDGRTYEMYVNYL